MKRSLFAALGLFAMVASATAADLPRQYTPYRSPAAMAYNWTGFYVGLNAGGAWGRTSWDGFGTTGNVSGGMIGLTAGYNWQAAGSAWVFGLEGDVDWTGISGSHACSTATTCEAKNKWLSTIRGRVGYAWDRIMPYITGGGAFGNIDTSRTGFIGASDVNAGWTVGLGVEAAIAGNWTAKAEYLYADFGSTNCTAIACGTATNVDMRPHILRAGVNYRF